jgi:glycerol-3-phosphate dehydrogenase
LVHRGLLPTHRSEGAAVRFVKQSVIRDHRQDGVEGLVSVVGTRYTTARDTAEHAVTLACQLLGVAAPPCRTATTPLSGGDVGDPEDFVGDVERSSTALPAAARRRIARLYGTEWRTLERIATERPELAEPLSPDCEALGVEIVYAAREEMAVTLGDAMLRRSDAGSAGHPGAEALARAADIMASEKGWSVEQRQEQVADVERCYRILD